MAHSSSKKWISAEARYMDRYRNSQEHINRMFPHSPFVPRTKQEWLEYQSLVADARAQREKQRSLLAKTDVKVFPPLGDKKMEYPGAFFFSVPTIWCDKSQFVSTPAKWPDMPEMKWEGDDRARTGFGRFLPVPRERGSRYSNPKTTAWHFRQRRVPLSDLDAVWRVPTMEDIVAPVDEIDESVVEGLLNKDLREALDDCC